MTKLTKVSFIALIIIVMTGFFVAPVKADGETTTTRTETVCDTGSYGVQNCHEVTTVIPVHNPQTVNTGIAHLDLMVLAIGMVLAVSTATYIYTK